ncbi:MAG: hypothetical protein ABSE49_09870 [Polyangiaceae bacterium]|jgi:uncharacterized membrane protein
MNPWQGRLRIVLGVGMVAVGITHFASPRFFVSIVPSLLPAPLVLVLVSGFFEVLGGVGLFVPRARRAASVGLVLLYLAVFPANINMVVHPELGGGVPVWVLWLRLPLQMLFIAWALWAGGGASRRDAALAGDGADR